MNKLTLLLFFCAGVAYGVETDPMKAARQIDALLAADWQKHQLQPNPPASDEVFVRRIHLDIVGRIPTHRESTAFLVEAAADKRTKLIDQLLASEGYVLHQFHYWADLLRVWSKGTYNGNAGLTTGTAYSEYVKESVWENKPYDRFVHELVTAQGVAYKNGAVGYYQRDRGMPLDNMALTARVFLGTRIECAQCHDHPFDKWTQKEFYQLSAFTYGVQTAFGTYSPNFLAMLGLKRERRERTGGKVDDEVFHRLALNEMTSPLRHTSVSHKKDTLRLPDDYQYPDAKPKSAVAAATLMGRAIEGPSSAGPLELFGAWLTSPENPRFSKVIANRLWKKVFGLGLVEPVDDWRDDTAPANPELLAYLEPLLVGLRYDVKAFLRVLFNTQAYQREVTRAEIAAGTAYHFPGPILRRMSAEQMWDSFVTLIDPAPDLPHLPAREATDRFLCRARKLGDALDGLPPEEMLQRADATSAIFREHSTKMKALQTQLAEARAQKDKDKTTAISRELSSYRPAQMKEANDHIFVPAVLRLAGKVTGTAPVAADGVSFEQIPVPGYEPKDWTVEHEAQTKFLLADAAHFGLPEAQRSDYVRHRTNTRRLWHRAAEMESPAPPGHALREFGQSDRAIPENANSDASIPQALVLMNSQILPQALAPWSQLKLVLSQSRRAEEKVDAAYLTILSRKPTASEMSAWRAAQSQGLTDIDDFLYALLNTQQFLFIQ